MKALAISSCALSALLVSPAFAQTVSPETQAAYDEKALNAAEAINEDGGRVATSGSPNNRAAAGFSSSNVQITSEQGETSVSVAFSLDIGSQRATRDNGSVHLVTRRKLSVVLSAPIDQSTQGTNIFSGDSLVSGSTGKLSFTSFSTTLGDGEGARKMRKNAYLTCVRRKSAVWVAGQPNAAEAQVSADKFVKAVGGNLIIADQALDRPGANDMSFEAAITTSASHAGKVGEFVTKACVPSGEDGFAFGSEIELVDEFGDDPAAFRKQFFPKGAEVSFWGVDASIGQDDYSFLDRTAFKLEAKPRTTWEVGAYYGWINSDLTFSLRGRAVYGQSYKDQDEAEICRTVSIPAGDECIKGPDGEPLRQRTGLVSVEARKLVTVREGTQIAFAPQVTYRIEDKNLGVEVPIYLAPDAEGKLTGGIKAVYNSKGDEFAVGLFVGVPFSIFYD